MSSELTARFTAALDALVAQLQQDRTVLAAILGGSLSHDTVWEHSDIDLVLVVQDDRRPDAESRSLYADGVNVHAMIVTRSNLRRIIDGTLVNSFIHAFLAKGRLLYAHDETIPPLLASLNALGARDTTLQLLRAMTDALPPLYKAHKWMRTRGDPHYTALWLLYTASPIARIEIVERGLVADREVIPQAAMLNPALFATLYTGLLDGATTRASVQHALDVADAYVAKRAPTLLALVVEHLRDVGEARSATEIEDHFVRHCNVRGVTTACEYLADRGIIGKTGLPVKVTKKSNVAVQELAFYALR